LLAYVKGDHGAIPALRMMRLSKEEIEARAQALRTTLAQDSPDRAGSERPKMNVELIDGESVIGGGAAPSSVLPTKLLAVSCADLTADALCTHLRNSDLPIIARVEDGQVLLDLRTVAPEHDALLAQALRSIA
jgi:L-seryl-tRNA(Ser) seleniumtransferase